MHKHYYECKLNTYKNFWLQRMFILKANNRWHLPYSLILGHLFLFYRKKEFKIISYFNFFNVFQLQEWQNPLLGSLQYHPCKHKKIYTWPFLVVTSFILSSDTSPVYLILTTTLPCNCVSSTKLGVINLTRDAQSLIRSKM